MWETFKRKSPGDVLYAAEVNEMFDAARQFGLLRPGSNLSGTGGAVGAQAPWLQTLAVVSKTKEQTGDGLFRCLLRYWNDAEKKWATSHDKEWPLDAEDLGQQFAVGDKVIVYWDEQRGAFIPVGTPKHKARWIQFRLEENLSESAASCSAEVVSYWDGTDPDEEKRGVVVVNMPTAEVNKYLFHGSRGAVGIACHDPDADNYHIVNLECP